MLARVEKEEGIELGRTNWEGTELALELGPGTSRARALEALAAALPEGSEAVALPPDEARAALAAIERGEWLDHEACFALSMREASVLGREIASRLRARLALDESEERLVARAAETGCLTAFRRFHEGLEPLSNKSLRRFWRAEILRAILELPGPRAGAIREALAHD